MNFSFANFGASTAAVLLESVEVNKLRDVCGTVTEARRRSSSASDDLLDDGEDEVFSMSSTENGNNLQGSSTSVPNPLRDEAMFHLSSDDVARFAVGYERESDASFLERHYAARELSSRPRSHRMRFNNGPVVADSYWGRICQTKMRVGASVNSLELVKRLLKSGLTPNFQDEKGRSPLHVAAARGFGDMVELLLRHGADPNVEDCRGNIPLHLAACTSSVQAVNALCAAGSDVLHRSKDGTTPIEISLSRLQAMRKSATVSEERKVAYEQSFHILKSGLRMFSTIPRPLEKVKSNLEAVLGLSRSPEEDAFESQLDGLLSALSGLSMKAKENDGGSLFREDSASSSSSSSATSNDSVDQPMTESD